MTDRGWVILAASMPALVLVAVAIVAELLRAVS